MQIWPTEYHMSWLHFFSAKLLCVKKCFLNFCNSKNHSVYWLSVISITGKRKKSQMIVHLFKYYCIYFFTYTVTKSKRFLDKKYWWTIFFFVIILLVSLGKKLLGFCYEFLTEKYRSILSFCRNWFHIIIEYSWRRILLIFAGGFLVSWCLFGILYYIIIKTTGNEEVRISSFVFFFSGIN